MGSLDPTMSVDEKYALISRNLQEVLGECVGVSDLTFYGFLGVGFERPVSF